MRRYGLKLGPQHLSSMLDQVLSFPFPENLVAAQSGSRIAWTLNVRGVRNVYVAEGPNFAPRQLTRYDGDDGQALTAALRHHMGKTGNINSRAVTAYLKTERDVITDEHRIRMATGKVARFWIEKVAKTAEQGKLL